MIQFTDMTGLASSTVAMIAVAIVLPGIPRLSTLYRIGLACAVAVVALVPFGTLPLAAYLRGIIGDLSIVSMILLLSAILNRLAGCQLLDAQNRFALLALVALAALGLYPLALGIGTFDPYRLGYGNIWFMSVLLVVALIACFRQLQAMALVIALAVFAWDVGWYESTNLWDYLLDPLLAIYAICALVKRGTQVQQKQPS